MNCSSIPNHLLVNCRLFNHRDDIIPYLPNNQIIAEVGVLAGDFSQLLLSKAKKLHLIDLYNACDWEWSHRFNSQNHFDFVRNRFKDDNRVQLYQGNSYDVLAQLTDNYFDIIYIDGDHSYEVVKKDLEVAYHKLKLNGWLWINDYTTFDPLRNTPYGVQKATNEIINTYQMPVIYFAFNNSNFHDICLKKISN